jgi:tetratricopeptide (TPR) repeat protein/TolB-like protein
MRRLFIILVAGFIVLLTAPPLISGAKKLNILVYPFKNTGSEQYSWISAGMTDTVISDLHRIKGVRVISERDRRKAIQEIELGMTGLIHEETIVKVGKITGANLIFTGSYLISGNRIRVNAKLIRVETGQIEKSIKIDGVLDKIFDLQDRIIFSLMAETEKIRITDIKPVRFDSEDRQRIKSKQKPELSAYEWYSRGLEVHYTNPKKALEYYLKALNISPDYFDALNRTGWMYYDLSQHQKSIKYYLVAERVLREQKLQNTNDFATIMNGLGAVYQLQGALHNSLRYYTRALEIMEQLGLQQTSDYAATLGNIGVVYRHRGEYDKALKYYFNALRIYESLGMHNSTDSASVLNNIGLAYKMKKEYNEALTYYFRAKKIEESSGLQKTKHYATVLNNIATAYNEKGDHDTALPYFKKNIEIMDQLGLQKTYEYAGTMNNVSAHYHFKGDHQKAMEYALISKKIMEELKLQNTSEYAITNWWIGIYYHKLKKSCQGIPYMQRAIRILQSNNYPEIDAARKYYKNIKSACGR